MLTFILYLRYTLNLKYKESFFKKRENDMEHFQNYRLKILLV